MDTDNPIVKLCTEGMQAEGEGRHDDAARLFQRAWDASTDDYEACIAAHYVARHQPSDADTLHWNRVALERAERVEPGRVGAFFPSLYLNVGRSHESLGELAEARRFYDLAHARLDVLPPGPYTDVVRHGVAAALARLHARAGEGDAPR